MSALSDQLIRHKFSPPKVESPAYMALIEMFKKGVGKARAHEIVELAYERVHPNDDAEIADRMTERSVSPVSLVSSPEASGSDSPHDAPTRQSAFVTPARAPLNLTGSVAQGARDTQAQSVFDRIKTSDGRAWGDVGAHELDGMSRDGAFAVAIKDHIGMLSNSQRFKKVRELISADKFEQIRKQANAS